MDSPLQVKEQKNKNRLKMVEHKGTIYSLIKLFAVSKLQFSKHHHAF